MSRLLDTTICPDCRGALDPSVTCTACGLQVKGPLALQLWDAMVVADGLIQRLRQESVPTPLESQSRPQTTAPAMAPGNGAGACSARPTPEPRSGSRHPTKSRLPSASVPVVLLTLGALCLLVAAIVFIAVTWSLLGLTGRTVVLLVFTGVLATVAVVLTRAGPAWSDRDLLARGGRHAHGRPPRRRVGRTCGPGCPVTTRDGRAGRWCPAGHGRRGRPVVAGPTHRPGVRRPGGRRPRWAGASA